MGRKRSTNYTFARVINNAFLWWIGNDTEKEENSLEKCQFVPFGIETGNYSDCRGIYDIRTKRDPPYCTGYPDESSSVHNDTLVETHIERSKRN